MPKRRDLMKLPVLFAPMAMFAAKAPGLKNETLAEAQAKVTKEEFGDLKIYFEGSTAQLASMTAGSLKLKPGMSPHPPHSHPEEEFLQVAEGTGEITVDGKMSKVGPGSIMYSAANTLHGIKNTGKSPLLFFFYKWKA